MSQPKYWRGLEEWKQSPDHLEQAKNEFPTSVPLEDMLSDKAEEALGTTASRRDFMKLMGFGITAATLAACAEGPVKKAIPYVNKPDDIIPGVPNWYASTTPSGVPVLVKTREGRPIKLEGNPDSTLTNGGLDAVGQASLLDLYDQDRARKPRKGGDFVEWGDLDAELISTFQTLAAEGATVRVLSRTLTSPSSKAAVAEFLGTFGENGQHITYEPASTSAIAQAHALDFGVKAFPSLRFDRAKIIASFSCDFLGSWGSTVEYLSQWASHRSPDGEWMSRHYQIESILSNTGANADMRFTIKPSQEALVLANLYNKVASRVGQGALRNVPSFNLAANSLDKLAADLLANRGESLVVSGTNNVTVQRLVNGLNMMLGNYGKTVDLDNPSMIHQADDEALASLVAELRAGSVDALILLDANPVYDTPYGEVFAKGLKEAKLSISLSIKEDESSKACRYHLPSSHFLESWGDAQQRANIYSLVQPAIHPIFKTRQAEESLLRWSGNNVTFRDYVKTRWEATLYPVAAGTFTSFRKFWEETLRKGVLELPASPATTPTYNPESLQVAVDAIGNVGGAELEIAFYQKVGTRDGRQANNPWIQEMPDPVSKIVWDDYVSVPFTYAEENGLELGQIVDLTVNGTTFSLPVLVQPGQANGVLAVALGYGRTDAGRVAKKVGGVNVYPFVGTEGGSLRYASNSVSLSKTTRTYELAQIQTYDLLYDENLGRRFAKSWGTEYEFDRTSEIVKETVLGYYQSKDANNPYRKSLKKYEAKKAHLVTLWESHFEDPETSKIIHWAMSIDLNKCTGCGACVVACQAENNIPVVGKKEVLTRREMHWMRIDRYYSGDPNMPDTVDAVFQPMLCQHCDNAPCETVCPVLATIHSTEGLNQMTYNRCVGTRYCANNCPYKVRRFNWFNYTNGSQFTDVNPSQSELGRLVLNPDVTVRFRGVMEKCTFCVQRLQDKKLRAKINGNSTYAKPDPNDRGYTACQQTCPTGAIVFGDRNDPNSEINKLWYDPASKENERKYHVIEEVKTLSSIAYLTKVRNRTGEEYEERQRAFNAYKSAIYGVEMGEVQPAAQETESH